MMSVRFSRMESILEEMGDGEFYPRQLMLLVQGLFGFREDVCVNYVEDMQRLGLLEYGSLGRLKKK